MIHRGPDDAGIWQAPYSSGFVGLAHRRLSIFDLSMLGHQPMHSRDNRLSIVFNGEIYNFRELRSELESIGYSFLSECDTEVVLYAYDKWREECFPKMNGMFAIAIWDREEEKLIIARDRLGVKPLYYYWDSNSADFVFASELKPIMEYPHFVGEVDIEALGDYLCYKYLASPKTIFKNTFKLEPGTYAVYSNNELRIDCYWDILERKQTLSENPIRGFREAKESLNEVLTDAVMKRLVADVPVGTFLSSGIDSALITAIAQKNLDTPVRTFTIGFNEKERDEADRALEIAKYLGTDHTELYIGDKEIIEMLDDITTFYDEPFADSSQLPTMLVSKLASDHVTVALSGDGGDELFCGYKMYDLVYIAQKADFIGRLIHSIPPLAGALGKQSPELKAFINNRGDYRTQLFVDVFADRVSGLLGVDRINPKHGFEERLKYRNWQERRMILDMHTYLPDEIMHKTDRASMKYSLEVRSPLLDYRVVEKSFEIPHGYKYHHMKKKYVLRELAYDYVPREYLSGPKKGFGIPLAKWLRGVLRDEIRQYSEEQFLKSQGVFDAKEVKKLIGLQDKSDNILYSSILWSFYMFQRWWEMYMK